MIKEFFKPSTIEEALKFKNESKDSYYLGGGTKLNHGGESYGAVGFISLEGLNLKGIKKEGTFVVIGASETLTSISESDQTPSYLKESCLAYSNRNIRNASTLGGVLGASKSACPVAGILMAAGAIVKTASKGDLSLESYLESAEGELILSVSLPTQILAFQKIQKRSANARPEIVISSSLTKEGDKVTSASVVIGGVGTRPFRLEDVEKELIAGSLKNADAVQDSVMEALVPSTKEREHGTYLNYISGVMAADTVGRCMKG